ncbi:MAG TPA: isocitrate lyase/phosphoenolpyruvate mutase family protein [Candidatus Krumholzibacteria bacterium]|nr:isocitrate lyase/phosphoenolpyruvate mutase family protein [Candidatus Krumholzibacteria bacterium]
MASRTRQKEKAATLLSLHTGGKLLVLPNVWDPLGARILQTKGFPAIATASAAISASLGFKDGERIKLASMIEAIGRIARSVDVPVTADIEAGYATTVSELEDTIRAVIDAGVVGINLEDAIEDGRALRSMEDQCARIAVVRDFAARQDVHLVINARTDCYHVPSAVAGAGDATEEAVARAAAYAKAGADCIYPLGPGDEATVKILRARIAAPINILMTPTAAPLPVLESIGVNRVSFGPYVHRTLTKHFVDIADAVMKERDASVIKGMLTKDQMAEYLLDGPE